MSYTVTGLKRYTQYTVTVTAINGDGEGHPKRVSILTDGEGYFFFFAYLKYFFFLNKTKMYSQFKHMFYNIHHKIA